VDADPSPNAGRPSLLYAEGHIVLMVPDGSAPQVSADWGAEPNEVAVTGGHSQTRVKM